jgi:hypothetical protein
VKKSKSLQQASPLTVVRGEQINATYKEQLIPEYKGNPLIEALPPLWTKGEVEQMLSYFPYYDTSQRALATELRLHLLENAREFFIPQGIHYEIHLSISNMLRRGYIDRNPVLRGMWSTQLEKIAQIGDRLPRRTFLRSKARGLCIVGPGGVGKSTAVENVLSLYPQVITHTRYKEQDFILKQLVWVKLQCPNDGSLRSLCVSFLEEVDDILGTNYIKSYSAARRTVDALLSVMARVASNHFLGVIAFDEIQDLSEAKSGGAARMLNFFVQLENTLGIPFILIGTPKAEALFSGEFRQARRVSEQGDIYWRPMREIAEKEHSKNPDTADPDWSDFVRAMWKYWYLTKDRKLPKDLIREPVVRTLYEKSKGITALVVTIFFLAQRRAITSGVEELTSRIIKSVVTDNQHFVEQVLKRMHEGRLNYSKQRVLSDLNSSAWQWPEAALTQQHDNKTANTSSAEASLQKSEQKSKTGSAPADSLKRRSSKRTAQTYEAGDFRTLYTESKEQPSGEQTPSDEIFGSTDEFS